jgi:hypothetical protein
MVGLRWLALIGFAYFLGGSMASFAVGLLLVANFLEDQTVHLSQENHKDADISLIEKSMLAVSWFIHPLAWILALCSIYLLVNFGT